MSDVSPAHATHQPSLAHPQKSRAFAFALDGQPRQAGSTSAASSHPAADDADRSPCLRSGPHRVGPAFPGAWSGQGSADAPACRAEVIFSPFPFSNIGVCSASIKTLNRGSLTCSNQLSWPSPSSHRFCRAASRQMVRPLRPIAQPCAPLVAPQPVPLSPAQPAAPRPKARLSAPSSVACRAAFPACQPAIDCPRLGGSHNRTGAFRHHQRPSGAAPRMAFSYGGRPCFQKS